MTSNGTEDIQVGVTKDEAGVAKPKTDMQGVVFENVVKITEIQKAELATAALAMRAKSYAPYSGFCVGAALLGKSGKIYGGCNIENASYTPTNCAERTAIFKAISEGEQEFVAIAIAGGQIEKEPENYCAPCGVCRQVLREFCSDELEIILVKSAKDYKVYNLGELLPESFGPNNLKTDN